MLDALKASATISFAGSQEVLTIAVSLIPVAINHLAVYLSERRAKRSWDGILKAVEIYRAWVNDGEKEALLGLRSFIDQSIVRQTSSNNVAMYIIGLTAYGVVGAAVNLWLIINCVKTGNVAIAIMPCVSLIYLIVVSLRGFRTLHKHRESSRNFDDQYALLMDGSVAMLVPYVLSEHECQEELERIEREDEVDRRLAEHYAKGDAFLIRHYYEAAKLARDRVVEQRLRKYVDSAEGDAHKNAVDDKR